MTDQHLSYHAGFSDDGIIEGSLSPSLVGEAVSYKWKAQASEVSEGSGPAPRFQPNMHESSMEWTPEERENAQASEVFEGSRGAQKFQTNLHEISIHWTPEEQEILEKGLVKYASGSSITRYANIASPLENKSIRDVALRCRWMATRDFSKGRNYEDLNLARKGKARKVKICDSPAAPHNAAMLPRFAACSHGGTVNDNDARMSYTAIGGSMGQLLQQNALTLDRISANLAANQMHENIPLLSHARGNLLHILNNLSDPRNLMKKMPPLPVKIDQELANSILPFGIQ